MPNHHTSKVVPAAAENTVAATNACRHEPMVGLGPF